jgi:hypothetical protein
MRLVQFEFTATGNKDIRSTEVIVTHFRPKVATSHIIAGISGDNNDNRMSIAITIYNTGQIILQKNYNDGVPSDETFVSGTKYTIYNTNVTYMGV